MGGGEDELRPPPRRSRTPTHPPRRPKTVKDSRAQEGKPIYEDIADEFENKSAREHLKRKELSTETQESSCGSPESGFKKLLQTRKYPSFESYHTYKNRLSKAPKIFGSSSNVFKKIANLADKENLFNLSSKKSGNIVSHKKTGKLVSSQSEAFVNKDSIGRVDLKCVSGDPRREASADFNYKEFQLNISPCDTDEELRSSSRCSSHINRKPPSRPPPTPPHCIDDKLSGSLEHIYCEIADIIERKSDGRTDEDDITTSFNLPLTPPLTLKRKKKNRSPLTSLNSHTPGVLEIPTSFKELTPEKYFQPIKLPERKSPTRSTDAETIARILEGKLPQRNPNRKTKKTHNPPFASGFVLPPQDKLHPPDIPKQPVDPTIHQKEKEPSEKSIAKEFLAIE
jgi:hypothetical protein